MASSLAKVDIKAPLAVLLALILGYLGQAYFLQEGPALDGVILFGLASLFLLAVAPRRDEKRATSVAPAGRGWMAFLLVGLGLVFVCLSLVDLYVSEASNRALVAWLVGLGLFVAGFWVGSPRPAWRLERRELLVLLLILLVGLFMRTYRLSDMPPGLYLDEADNGVWALRFLQEPYSPFTEQRHGNATLPFQLLGVTLRVFGVETVVLRAFDVVVGMATVVVFYFLAREMFGVPAALIGTAFLAVSRWHVHFSRVGFVDNLQVPLFESLVVLFLWRGLRGGRRLDYVFAGLSFGLGFHTYLGYRVFPLVIGLYLLHLAVSKRGLIRAQLSGLLIFLLATFVTLSPLALYAVQRPEIFLRRAEAASVMQDVQREGSYEPLLENVRKSLLMYNDEGDPRPRHNLPHEPMLDGLSAIFFGLGVGYCLLHSKEDRYFLPVAWLLVGLLPGVLSLADSNPHSLRTLGNVPAVFLLIAAFWDRAWATYAPLVRKSGRRYLALTVSMVVMLGGIGNARLYFGVQAADQSVYYDFDPAQTEAGEYVKAHGADHLVLVSHALTNHADLKFIPYGVPFTVLDFNAHLPLREGVDRDVIYVLDWGDAALIPRLRALYPGGEYVEHLDRYGHPMFYTYEVSQEEVTGVQGLNAAYYEGTEFEGPAVTERVDKTLDLSRESLPVSPPYSARWWGSLYVPRYGSYTFVLEANGWATLRVGHDLELEVEDGRAEQRVELPAGFQAIEVETVQEEAGQLQVRWIGPEGQEEVIPTNVLYTAELYGHGLLGLYRYGTEWEGQAAVIQLDSFIAPNDVLPSPFSIEWLGKIYVPVSGTYVFGTTSDDGSFLYLDGQLVVDNGGHHGDVYKEGHILLEEGFHDIRLLYFQDGGGQKIELYWTPPGSARALVEQEQLFSVGAELSIPSLPVYGPASQATPGGPAPGLAEVTFATSWGSRGHGPGEFEEPRGVAVSLQGTVYVADTGNARLQVFDETGEFVDEWGEGILGEPFDVAVGRDGRVYVVDTEQDCLFVFSPEGSFEERWGEQLALFDPRGLDVDKQGYVYIANTGGSVVIKVSPDGEVLASLGTVGSGPGRLSQPTDVAVDDDGNLYIVDSENERIQVLDRDGRYLREWPISPANTFDSPHLVWGTGGLLYLTDPETAAVIVYDEYGRLLTYWGEKGSLDGQFSKPIGIGFDQRTSLYVSDTYNHRIEKFVLSR
jgi:DNA-binding beta-propeller fold protein YncE/4-amino-4-deoxy-L-arabinose transferase-like glycosyltransferase